METILVRNEEEFWTFLRWYEGKYQVDYLVDYAEAPTEPYPLHVRVYIDDYKDIRVEVYTIADKIESLMQEIKTLLEFR